MADTGAVAAWLIDGARSAPRPDLVLEQLCDRLVAAGIPLSRVAVFVRIRMSSAAGSYGNRECLSLCLRGLSISMTKTNS